MAVGSFSAGLSGLNANAQALSVVGNNLANVTLLRERRLSVFYLGTGQRAPTIFVARPPNGLRTP